MSGPGLPSGRLVLDANVLIDFLDVAPDFLQLLADSGRRLCTTEAVVDKLAGHPSRLSARGDRGGEKVLARLGVEIVEVAPESIPDAAGKWRSLAFDDRTCFAAASRRCRVCVTNDRRLRAMCEEHGVRLLWGLDLLVGAFHEGLVMKSRAIEIFNGIKSNSAKGYITAEVEWMFCRTLGRS